MTQEPNQTETATLPGATGNVVTDPTPDPLAQVMARLDSLEQRNQQLEKVNSRKEAENQRLREAVERGDSQEAMTKAMLAFMSAQTGRNQDELETDVRTNQSDLVKQYENIVTRERQRRDEDNFKARVTEFQDRALDLGLTEDDGDYGRVFLAVQQKNWTKAEKILNEAEAKKKQPPPKEEKTVEPPKPSQADIEEAARKLLEEKGQLRTETPNPSSKGVVWTMEQIRALPPKDFAKNFPGGFVQVQTMVREGKIKV